MTTPKRLRILHVVGAMNRGGIETWLMHVLRHIDRDRFQMDFLVHSPRPGDYDDEIRALGGLIIVCPHVKLPWRYAPAFARILREQGPFDVVHSHVHHFSGSTLRLARRVGVPVRIAHSHNDTSALDARSSFARRGYLALMKRWIAQNATLGLAASRQAAVSLYGSRWEADPRWRILHYGIDLAPFKQLVNRRDVRAEFAIPSNALVIGHVGRFVDQKNHRFLVEIAAELASREPHMRLLLVGDGSLRVAIEQLVRSTGLASKTIFVGVRSDIPRLMLGAMDVFLLPSKYEGLGLVVIEAQAAGLPIVLSSNVPVEADLIPELVQRVSISQSATLWVDALLASKSNIDQTAALRRVEDSPFNIAVSVRNLERHYADS